LLLYAVYLLFRKRIKYNRLDCTFANKEAGPIAFRNCGRIDGVLRKYEGLANHGYRVAKCIASWWHPVATNRRNRFHPDRRPRGSKWSTSAWPSFLRNENVTTAVADREGDICLFFPMLSFPHSLFFFHALLACTMRRVNELMRKHCVVPRQIVYLML